MKTDIPFDLRQLKAFEAVARHGGFSRAAEEMGLTQPTLSTHIRNLEERLGLPLFDRGSRSVSLTPTGVLLAEYTRKILALCEESLQAVQTFTGRIAGSIKVDASTVPGEYLLPRWLADFNRHYPEVQVTLTVSDSATVLDRVERGETSIGITGSVGTNPTLKSTLLCKDRIILVAGVDGITGGLSGTIDAARLSEIPLIRRESGSGTQCALEKALEDKGIAPDSLRWTATLGSTRAVIEGVLSGLGRAFVSHCTVAREIELGTIVEIPVRDLEIRRGLYAVRHRNRTLSPEASCFEKELLKAGPDLETLEY